MVSMVIVAWQGIAMYGLCGFADATAIAGYIWLVTLLYANCGR